VDHLPLDQATALAVGDEADLAHAVDRGLQTDCLAAALNHLTEDQRRVIMLKFMEGRNNGQVARILNKSEGAVKSLQHRALNSLRRAIERERCYEA
jgi:RNA polymerase sigma-70 factor (ECF subfamily)